MIRQRGGKFCVCHHTGKVIKCFPTEKEAQDMHGAIMASKIGIGREIIRKSGINRVWIKPTTGRKGHWRKVKPGKGEEPKGKQKIGALLVEGLKKLVTSLTDKMNTSYAKRDEAISKWEKLTGQKYTAPKAPAKRDGAKKPGISKPRSKPTEQRKPAVKTEKQRLEAEIKKYQAEGDAFKVELDIAQDKLGAGEDKKASKGLSDADIAKITDMKSEMVKYQKERTTVKAEMASMVEKYRAKGTTPEEKKKLDRDYEGVNSKVEAVEKRIDELEIEIYKIENANREKPKSEVEGFSDDFAEVFNTETELISAINNGLGIEKVDILRKKYRILVSIYDGDYSLEKNEYQKILDHRKRDAGIPIDPNNKIPVTDSSIFDLKDGKNNLGRLTYDEAIEQLKAGGWSFEDQSFELDYDRGGKGTDDYNDTNIVVENGVVVGQYDTILHNGMFELRTLQVNPCMKRLGYGKKVMAFVIQDALDSGSDKLSLHSMDAQSNKFYEAIGMKETSNKIFEGDATWMKEYLEKLKNV